MVPWYIRRLRVIARLRKVTYKLDLPVKISQIHNNFDDSQLRKCLADYFVIVPLNDIQADEHLHYVERPITILYNKVAMVAPKWFRFNLGT